MPTVTIHLENGKLTGLTEKDRRNYARWHERIKTIGPKESLIFSWREPRSGAYHARHFAMLHALFDAQEQFIDEDQFRKWGEGGAGYADLCPGPQGKPIAVVKSISYEKLDQKEFEPVHDAVFKFYRTEYARRFLWPHLTDSQTSEMVDSILMEFEEC
jgi:hypothetical protein